jgi:hypothetical protein
MQNCVLHKFTHGWPKNKILVGNRQSENYEPRNIFLGPKNFDNTKFFTELSIFVNEPTTFTVMFYLTYQNSTKKQN